MKNRCLTILVLLALFLIAGCKKNNPPDCKITYPHDGVSMMRAMGQIDIRVDAYDLDGSVSEVQIYLDDNKIGSATDDGIVYIYWMSFYGVNSGSHKVKATAIDNDGNKNSDEIRVSIVP